MRYVLDATALVAILQGEVGAREASSVALDATVTAINFAEARDHLGRSVGDSQRAGTALQAMVDHGLGVVACDRDLAEVAAGIRTEHYHPKRRSISLADCFAIALALRDRRSLVSSDRDQLRVAAEVGVSVRPIANSAGVVPEL